MNIVLYDGNRKIYDDPFKVAISGHKIVKLCTTTSLSFQASGIAKIVQHHYFGSHNHYCVVIVAGLPGA